MNITRPAWIEIDLDKLKLNMDSIKRNINENTKIFSTVKSNAYGFGDIEIVAFLIEYGIRNFCVATYSEALRIKRKFHDVEILILGYTPQYLMEDTVKEDIQMTVYSLESAIQLDNIANELNKEAKINIAIDTGMNRIGFKINEKSIEDIEEISKLKNVKICGIFSHLAAADEDIEYTQFQYDNFMYMLDKLKERNVEVGIRHISNSQAILNYREYNLDAVRPGIIQYGSTELVESKYDDFKLEYIASLKCEIAHLKTIEKGELVGYGLTYKAQKQTKVATIPLGYADGILRQLSSKINVLINGIKCPQIGRICMDQMMIDVTGIDCKVGDEVVLIGSQKNESISISEFSRNAGEIDTSYSTHFSTRIPRIYIKDKKIYKIVDEIL